MYNERFGPPREFLEVYAKERETGRTAESLESWLRKRAYGHYEAALPAERPHCRAVMGMSMRQGESSLGFSSR